MALPNDCLRLIVFLLGLYICVTLFLVNSYVILGGGHLTATNLRGIFLNLLANNFR